MGSVAVEALDSAIVIDLLNGVGEAASVVEACSGPAISIITWIEVMAGLRDPTSEKAGRDLLALFELLPLSDEVAEAAVAIRRTRRLKLPDAVIYATAQVHKLTLITRNTKDFAADDPNIRVPYTLERGTLERGTLERGTLERGTLERGTLERGTLERGTLERGTLERGTP